MKYPSRKQCFEFYKELDSPPNILKHVSMVNKVAVFLARRLKQKGIEIDFKLIDRASLLHDLDKWLCLHNKNLIHGDETERILSKKGYPEIGFYAKQHVSDHILNTLKTWEEKVISHADRIVIGDKIVTVEQRFEYLNKRYPPKDLKLRKKTEKSSKDLENEILSIIKLTPEQLIKKFKN